MTGDEARQLLRRRAGGAIQAQHNVHRAIHADAEYVRSHAGALVTFRPEGRAGIRAEVNDDLLAALGQRLAGTQHEPRAGPAVVVDGEHDLGEGLGLPRRVDAVLIDVVRDLASIRPAGVGQRPRGIARSPGARDYILPREGSHRVEQLDLAVLQIARAQALRWLHRGEAEHLEHVVLHHVLERAGLVVEAGPTLQRQRFLPQDVDLLDGIAVPDRFQQPSGEPEADQVLHGDHAQRMVDPVHRFLARVAHDLGQEPVQRDGVVQLLPERLLEHDATALRQADVAERGHRRREQPLGQRQVGHNRAPVRARRLADDRGHGIRVGGVAVPVRDRARQRLAAGGGNTGGMLHEAMGRMALKPGVIPLLASRRDDPEPGRQGAHGVQRGQGRQQETAGEIPGGAEQQHGVDHGGLLAPGVGRGSNVVPVRDGQIPAPAPDL